MEKDEIQNCASDRSGGQATWSPSAGPSPLCSDKGTSLQMSSRFRGWLSNSGNGPGGEKGGDFSRLLSLTN